jgi:protein-S-isoprenylcysteine O-methyltransferase Ste14
MYGVVATSVASVALVVFSKFYGLDALTHPIWVIVAAVIIFSAAIILQVRLARRHATAHQSEYDKMDEPR